MSLPRFNENSYAHFVTARTYKNKTFFLDDNCCLILLKELDYYRKELGYKLLGYVIMTDHLHCIIYWDTEKYQKLTISKIMHDIKGLSAQNISNYILGSQVFSKNIVGSRGVSASTSCQGTKDNFRSQGAKALATHFKGNDTKALIVPKGKRTVMKIWQPSFYDFNIYSEEKLREKLNYIHNNPVRAGLCEKPEDYQWSSYRFYQFGKKGIIKINQL